jgi:dienelactone hydrolase
MRKPPGLIAALWLMGCLTGVNAAAAQAPHAQAPVVSEPGPGGVRLDQGGLLGNYYPRTRTGAGPAVLLLGGSEGGLGGGRSAQSLLTQGYSVLSLAYFGAPGLPDKLRLVPLEYFAAALQWLRAQPGVDPARIGLVGTSKGAEAALLIALRDPRIAAVAVGAPQSVVWIAPDSCGEDETSSWTSGGKPLEPLPCGQGDDVVDALTAYTAGLRLLPQHPAARIAAERIAAPILLECGEADSLGPSCTMARQIAAAAGPHKVQLLAYPDAGHASFGPPVAPSSPAYASLASLGGTVAGNAYARNDSWSKLLAFLNTHLRP